LSCPLITILDALRLVPSGSLTFNVKAAASRAIIMEALESLLYGSNGGMLLIVGGCWGSIMAPGIYLLPVITAGYEARACFVFGSNLAIGKAVWYGLNASEA